MNIDDKMIMDLAEQMGVSAQKGSGSFKAVEQKAKQYQNKSDEELIREILKLKESMKSDRAAYDKQLSAIKALGSMMKGEQKARLQKIIDLMES